MYQELHMSFLPADAAVVNKWLDKIEKSKESAERRVGMYADFEAFFGTLLAVKRFSRVHNTAVALRLMAELAGNALADAQAEVGDKAE
jgi:hypothetical protein